jgi:hypothetical protein
LAAAGAGVAPKADVASEAVGGVVIAVGAAVGAVVAFGVGVAGAAATSAVASMRVQPGGVRIEAVPMASVPSGPIVFTRGSRTSATVKVRVTDMKTGRVPL